ncbi:MAG: hypothetical protein CL450_06940 [Acidimicrobiaceae bacterium]|jgi:hypothetical protein|nr:hypothetical protein [Acidimicrobiaceae bacterium]|tara:strand:+ start:405 stop:605 length:201 start_codon:yes stop_codon:yes gene_type:complete
MAKLTSKQRNKLRKSQFALPSQRKYPINDKAHARNALARAAQHATPSQERRIKTAVYKKYPSLKNR